MIRKIREGLKREDGFTLIEMLVVVAVLGILATLAVPRIADVTERAEDAVAKANIKNFHVSMISHYMDSDGLVYPSDEDEFKEAGIDPADYGITAIAVSTGDEGAKDYAAMNTAYASDEGNVVKASDYETLKTENSLTEIYDTDGFVTN